MKKPKLTLVMPVHNEGESLGITLRFMKAFLNMPHEVLVVHDTVDDTSLPVVREVGKDYPQLRAVHNTLGRGVKNAIISGVRESGGEYVLIVVADDIGPVPAIGSMVALMDRGVDFVSATRYSKGGRVCGGHFLGSRISMVANMLFRLFGGSKLSDATVGFKMFRKGFFEGLELGSRNVGWVVAFELSIRAQLAGGRMGEVPIVSINRLYGGESTFKFGPWVKEYLKLFFRGVWMLRRGKV